MAPAATANGTSDHAAKKQKIVSTTLHEEHSVVLVLDYGSQYTQLICRRVREIGMYSLMFPGDATLVGTMVQPAVAHFCLHCSVTDSVRAPLQERVKSVNPKVVILSGGPNSVHLEGAPRAPEGFFEWAAQNSIPVLGICYGMQLVVQSLGGEVKSAEHGGEYGRMPILVQKGSSLYAYNDKLQSPHVWMSHGDEAVHLPDGFKVVAKSEQVSR